MPLGQLLSLLCKVRRPACRLTDEEIFAEVDGNIVISHDYNNTATKGNVCWGPRTEFLKPICSTCPDLCQLTSARNVEPESVDFFPRNGGGGGLQVLHVLRPHDTPGPRSPQRSLTSTWALSTPTRIGLKPTQHTTPARRCASAMGLLCDRRALQDTYGHALHSAQMVGLVPGGV